jgi:hypothetical protein
VSKAIVMVIFLAVSAPTAAFSFLSTSEGRSASAPVATAAGIHPTPPPAPVITKHPDNPTTDRNAHFEFTDRQGDVSFLCMLDWSGSQVCRSPQIFSNLRVGRHMFCVKAVDPRRNASSFSCLSWEIVGLGQTFSITGSPLPGVLLYPGGRPVPVNLVFTNPSAASITVIRATVTITGTSAPGCAASNFRVARQWKGNVIVPANSSQSLQGKGLPQPSWPQLTMRDNSNQDACKHATVSLSFTGTAR